MTAAPTLDVPHDPVTLHVVLGALRPFVRRSVLQSVAVGLLCAALAAAIAMALEAWNIASPHLPAVTPLSIAWVMLLYLLIGAPIFVILAAVNAEAGMEPARDHRPGVRIYPAWWVRFLCAWICMWLLVYVGGWIAGYLWPERGGNSGQLSAGAWFAGSAGMAFMGAMGWSAVDGIIWLVETAKLRRIKSLWIVISVAMGLFMGCVFCALLGAVTWGLNWSLVRAGLGSVWSMTTILGALPLALIVANLFGRGIFWQHYDWTVPSRPRTWDPANILTWDLENETSHAGIGANGYPYFIWRESADNRLGLSRPRFCTVVEIENELLFAFYNPVARCEPKRWPLFAVLLAITIAVGMLVVDAVLPAMFKWPAPFFGPRAYSVAILGAVALIAIVLAGALTSLAYIAATLFRWYWSRFEADGSFATKPLTELSGFQAAPADRLMAKGDPKATRSAEGLTAVFVDGTAWILTANAWEPTTIGEYHKELTNSFRTPRDPLVAAHAAKMKQLAQARDHRPGRTTDASSVNVPELL